LLAATPAPLLDIVGLASGYGDVQVLWGVDLSVARGEIVAIVGPNGAGKTTLLATISGMTSARQGRIVFDGEDLSRAAPDLIVARGVIHVPEGRRLFPTLTVKDNLLLGA
jgi:branched-chain amino acid transport system ATP-binding protein